MLQNQPFILDLVHASRSQELIAQADRARLRRACRDAAPARPPRGLHWPSVRLPHWLTGHSRNRLLVRDGGRQIPTA